MPEKDLADYTLEERKTDLTWAMTAIGASQVLQGDITIRFALDRHGFDAPMQADVRIMLNQWDVLIHGAGHLEEGHARGDADGVAYWFLHSAQLRPKERPPCQNIITMKGETWRCDYNNAYFDGERWLCLYCTDQLKEAADA